MIQWYKEEVIESFPELFDRLGLIKESYRIELQEDAKPFSISVPRRVPVPFMPKVKRELERMEQQKVITKVTEASDWCVGMVVVPKSNNKVRICLDLTKLNKYVKRERHVLPSVDQVLAQIGKAKHFSKLDANSGFWQIELSSESSKLTTFITPYGRYRFNRLPFGITSAPALLRGKLLGLHIVSKSLSVINDIGFPPSAGAIDDCLIQGFLMTYKWTTSYLSSVLITFMYILIIN